MSRKVHGVEAYSSRVRASLKQQVEKVLKQADTAALFLSMSLGVRDQLSRTTDRTFKETGLAHLLVVSGYQVSIIYFLVFGLLQKIILPYTQIFRRMPLKEASHIVAVLAVMLFIWLTGLDGSSLRAAIAILILIISNTLERGSGLLRSYFNSLLMVNILWPCCYLEPGVQLTFAALLGIIIGVQTKSIRLFSPSKFSFRENFISYCRVSLWASFLPALVSACWFNYLPLGTIFYNPLFGPLLSLVSCKFGFLGLSVYIVNVDPSGRILTFVGDFISYCTALISFLAKYPLLISTDTLLAKGALLSFAVIVIYIKSIKFIKRHLVLYGHV